MKQLLIVLGLITLTGCSLTSQNDAPTITVKQGLEQTDAPIAKLEKIVIEEWFDYGCHHCEQSHGTIKKLKAEYGDRLEVTERHFPLSAQTFIFAEASECARAQGKFDAFHDEIFTNYYGQFVVGNITKAAQAVAIPDLAAFNTCVTSGAQKDKVTADIRAAEKLGVTGTPFFQINNELNIPGAISEKSFKSLFDQLLTEA